MSGAKNGRKLMTNKVLQARVAQVAYFCVR